jgi:hypothetical protein
MICLMWIVMQALNKSPIDKIMQGKRAHAWFWWKVSILNMLSCFEKPGSPGPRDMPCSPLVTSLKLVVSLGERVYPSAMIDLPG